MEVEGTSKKQKHVTTDQVKNMRNQNYHHVAVCLRAPVQLQFTPMSTQSQIK